MNTNNIAHRYPNLKSFTAEERHLFFGRKREIEELFRLTVLHQIVVLFGKSGTGKTSLLQAGVAPQLEERLFRPVFMRLNRSGANNQLLPPEIQVQQILREGKYLPKSTPDNLTLWEYLKQFRYTSGGERYTPMLIFDQFEELFTLYTPEQRANFIAQFADLLNATMPAHLRQQLAADMPNLTPQQIADRAESPQLKIVISLRSDFLYLLDQLSAAIPAILRCRYELLPMPPTEAQKAIVEPAKEQSQNYSTPPFVYTPAALQQILDYLGKSKNNEGETISRDIESFQIQMVCSNIEGKVAQQKTTTVTPELYGGEAGLQKITTDFYANLLLDAEQQFGKDALLSIQNTVEKGLMRDKRRLSTDTKVLQADYGISPNVLQWLDNRYLLRKEYRMDSLYYEITHDTLIAPISQSYEARQQQEEKTRLAKEKEEADRKAKEAEAEAEKDRQLRIAAEQAKRKANIFTVIALIVALLAVLASGYAYQQKIKADTSSKQAKQAETKTQTALQKAEKLIDAFYFYDGKFALAYKVEDIGDGFINFFYFINKNGDAIEKLGKWTKAEQFDGSNFAKVQSNDCPMCLLDTIGNTYSVVYNLKGINKRNSALDLCSQQLTTVPQQIMQNAQLKVVLLGWNALTILPETFEKLTNLQWLDLNGNQLTTLPEGITKLSNLKALYVAENSLKALPQSIGQLRSLKTLELMNNQLAALPESIGNLSNLEMLGLDGNQLEKLPQGIAKLRNLKILNATSIQLSSLPEGITQLSNLQTLDLYGNQLTALPQSIGNLSKLQTLNLSSNLLSTLPQSIGQWSKLQTLDLNGNQLTILPESIGNLSNLQTLNLSSNQLTTLPQSIGQLSKLQSLDLNSNQLTALPKGIGQLSHLYLLDLNGNDALAPYNKALEGKELKAFLTKLSKGEVPFGQ